MKESMLPVTLQIGHEGATEGVVAELREQIRRKKVVKVKRLRTTDVGSAERDFWEALAVRAGARLLEVRGHSAVLADPRYRTERDRRRGHSDPKTPRNA